MMIAEDYRKMIADMLAGIEDIEDLKRIYALVEYLWAKED